MRNIFPGDVMEGPFMVIRRYTANCNLSGAPRVFAKRSLGTEVSRERGQGAERTPGKTKKCFSDLLPGLHFENWSPILTRASKYFV